MGREACATASRGKEDLATEAIARSFTTFREGAEQPLLAPGHPLERIQGYMLRPREPLKGCRIGRLTQDSEIMRNEHLSKPIEEGLAWLHSRLRDVIEAAQADGEILKQLDSDELAAMLVAVIQGGYMLASAQASPEPFHWAIRGALSFLHNQSSIQ